ncbi:MAG: GntR family transcriptional regulator [Anaerolineae bacterium]|nr:GntR family transcriptional regulator [Anaerolineae bacterium]
MNLTDAEKAYRQIKKQIISTKLSPGAVISESDLMSELRLGRTPIREAIKQLQANNLVTITPRRGMFVAEITFTDLTKIFEVRLVIEPLAARLAALRITGSQLDQLRQLAETYKDANQGDKETLISLDSNFHSLLAAATHNKFLQKDLQHYYNLSLRIWYVVIQSAQSEDIKVGSHLEILKEIEAGNAEGAGVCMKKHVEEFHQSVKLYL